MLCVTLIFRYNFWLNNNVNNKMNNMKTLLNFWYNFHQTFYPAYYSNNYHKITDYYTLLWNSIIQIQYYCTLRGKGELANTFAVFVLLRIVLYKEIKTLYQQLLPNSASSLVANFDCKLGSPNTFKTVTRVI